MNKAEPIPELAEHLRRFLIDGRSRYGSLANWWPGSPWEVALSAILVQQSAWDTAWASLLRLKRDSMSHPDRLATTPVETIADILHPVSFYRQKSRAVTELARFLVRRETTIEALLENEKTQEVRSTLLAQRGIGPETADAILLYAGGHAVFVVDAYTRRILARTGWLAARCDPETATYDDLGGILSKAAGRVAEWIGENTVDVHRELHAQFVETARQHCHKRNANCPGCVNESHCDLWTNDLTV